ncbi:hypothetical protein T03_8030 [Trichinella britovi]|uniref:Uncharacterized protein n=1 Tax=Trichinella britovi TaxID=45882 RepID=A0A0V0ZFX7_TRIBR|nr:hypothetical protein T03_8030 [Trichinella britovi]
MGLPRRKKKIQECNVHELKCECCVEIRSSCS